MSSAVVKAMAIRLGDRQPMVEVTEQRACPGRGLDGDRRAKGKRGLTLLSVQRWNDTVKELDKDLPWHTRRANVLIDGMDLAGTIGKRVRIGQVEVHIWDETRPCDEMDEFYPGLRNALKPETRGGVHGEILNEGVIHVGDPVVIVE